MKEESTKKYIINTLDAINSIGENTDCFVKLKLTDFKTNKEKWIECPISLSNEENNHGIKFIITIPNNSGAVKGIKHKQSYGIDKSLKIYNGVDLFTTNSDSVKKFKTSLPKGNPLTLEGVFTNVNKQIGKKYKLSYRRLIVRMDDEHPTFPTMVINRSRLIKYDNELLNTQQDDIFGIRIKTLLAYCIDIEINSNRFHIYAIKDYKILLIDSVNKIEKSSFEKISYIIRIAFAFLCGKFYRGEIFSISYSDSKLKNITSVSMNVESETSITENAIVNYQHLYEYTNNHNIDGLKNEHKKHFPNDIFAILCKTMFNNIEFLRSIQFLVNGSSTNSSIQKGALYSVSIETLTNFVSRNIAKSVPVKEKKLINSIKNDLKSIIKKYEKELSDEAKKVLSIRIDNINQATNVDKLTNSFEMLKINLSAKDVEIIKHRNAYLHGTSPKGLKNKFYLEPIAIHLHYLISILILKYIGYSGHTIYLPN